jgi:hypothetical protein
MPCIERSSAGTIRALLLTKSFSPDRYADALESWEWIGLDDKAPTFTSLFGHVFLQNREGYWYLDVISGTLEMLWPDAATLQAVLDTDEGQDEFLLGGLALGAARRGLVLADNQVYDFTPPPVLGGPFDLANVGAADFVVAVNIAGQIHQQVRQATHGTTVASLTVNEDVPAKRAKFWRRR